MRVFEVDMRRRMATVGILSWSILVAVSCQQRSPLEPSRSGTLDQLLQALRQQGLTVRVVGEIPPEVNHFFSVPAHQLLVNGSHVSAFEYSSAEAAAADAALVRPDGQPSILSVITWVSTPRFYRQDRLIVLYVGCSTEVVQALDVTVGPAFVIGRTPCEIPR
jgi:hypothetical protein